MIKRLLSLVTAFVAFCCIANAQAFQRNEAGLGLKYNKIEKMAPTRAAAEGVVFTYAQGDTYVGVGAGTDHYDCAIFVPGKFAGNKIDQVGFYLIDHKVVKNVKCWIAKDLPSSITPSGCEFLKDITPTTSISVDGNPEIVTVENYTIPAEGCYVGYSFDVTSLTSQAGQYPIAFDGSSYCDEYGGYVCLQGKWDNMASYGFGNLLTLVSMSGDNFLGNAASFVSDNIGRVITMKNGNVNISAMIKNDGVTPMTSVSYTVKDVATGETSAENTVNLDNVEFNNNGVINIPLTAGNEAKEEEKEIVITKVNGQPNETANATCKGSLIVLTNAIKRRSVVEEFTATGCGYCTRGYAGMAALADKYPESFIGIAVHGKMNYDDPMRITDYNSVMATVQGYPSAFINRGPSIDPYFGTSQSQLLGVLDDFEASLTLTEAEMSVWPEWNESQTEINVITDVQFFYSSNNAPYALAYVLLADGLQGSESNWWQTNYYSGATGAENEPYIYEYTQKGEQIKDMVYDHVAIMAKDVAEGIKGSIAAPLVADAVQRHETTFDLSNGVTSASKFNLLQDKSKLKVVAMLINTETGEIVNAAERAVGTFGTGINVVDPSEKEVKEVARYTIDGVQLSAPAKGINIVKMSDGTTRKVVVKQ